MNYLTSIIQAGGTPLVVPVVEDPALLESYLDRIAGLLLIGGRDISPARYGASAHPLTVSLPAMREEFDLRLVGTAPGYCQCVSRFFSAAHKENW
jgi:putative glutamine amidotransferase